MKKTVVIIFLMIANVIGFAQPTSPVTSLTKNDYLQKSKRQKTIAQATGITGLSLFTIGLFMYMSDFADGLPGGDPGSYNENKVKTGETLMYVGGGLTLVAIPFAMAAVKNKKMAGTFSASLKIENRSSLTAAALKRSYFPAFVFRFDL